MPKVSLTGYLAPEDLEAELKAEIDRHPRLKIEHQFERLFVVSGPPSPLVFAQNCWLDLQVQPVSSITDTAKFLRSQGPLWSAYDFHLHRRQTLIQEQLPKLKSTTQIFGEPAPDRPLGAWLLEDEKTLWYAKATTSPFIHGKPSFVEDKSAPSRAYLKLWEYFTLQTQGRPQAGERCLDLGASPGGWTWVLAQLGCQVIAVDKAPLTPALQKHSRIQSLKKDAFTLDPNSLEPQDWLFSDIICYPPKLYDLVQKWLDSGRVRSFVCTIKFQGATDFQSMDQFLAIPGSKIQHLSANKHEVTWSLLRS